MAKQQLPATTVEPVTEAQAIVARLIATGAQINIDLPTSLPEQQQWALTQYDAHVKSGVQLGYALVVIKQQMGHGEFGAWLDSNGINQRTARAYMKVAKFLCTLNDDSKRQRVAVLDEAPDLSCTLNDDSKRRRVAVLDEAPDLSDSSNTKRVSYLNEMDSKTADSAVLANHSLDIDQHAETEIDAVLEKIIKLPLRKQLELAKQPPERIRDYMQSGLFDEIDRLSPTDIRQLIRQQKLIEKLRIESGNATHREFLKKQELDALKTLPEERRAITLMRQQVLQDCELINGAMQRLRKVFEQAKRFTHELNEDAKNQVALPAIHTLEAIQGHAYEINRFYRDRFEVADHLPVAASKFSTLTDQEVFLITEAVANQQAATQTYEAALKKRLEEDRTNRRKP